MPKSAASSPAKAADRLPETHASGQEAQPTSTAVNFWAVFASAPDAYLLLAPDAPRFTIVAANDARLHVTMTRRADLIGRPLFEAFPDNPTDPAATGVRNLRASFEEVLRTGRPHRMALQKYDIRRPDGTFEERYWDPLNSPVFDKDGKLIYIIHRVEDVTEQVRTGRRLRALEVANDETVRQLSRESAARARQEELRAQVTTILERITDAFFAVDPEWRFTYVNREAERLLRRPRDELVGRSVWSEFPAAAGATFERQYRRAMEERTTVQFEEYFRPLDIWFDVHAYPSDTGLSVFFRDITARKRAEERLRESEERYRLLADLIPQSIWVTDAQGYHGYFSRRWYDLTGASFEDTKGAGWMRFLHPDDRERTAARWQQSLRTGERYSIEYRFRKHTGEYCWFWGQAVPQRNDAGEIVQWIGTLTDISARKAHEEERERLLTAEREARAVADRRREELERVTESRTRLMRGFSHDVKNPLGAADGFAALLEEGIGGELTDAQRQSVQRIRRSIQMSLRLIHDLLELARAESGQIELALQQVDVAELTREVAEDFRGQIDTAGLSLEVRAPEPLPAQSDPTRVRQILSNLVSNATKYTRAGHVILDACRRTSPLAPTPREWIAIEVIDTGPGIPPEKQETIFQEFTRLDPNAPHGAGVGLAISRRVAQLLGGDVTVESEVGRGSTFTLWLPESPGAQQAPR